MSRCAGKSWLIVRAYALNKLENGWLRLPLSLSGILILIFDPDEEVEVIAQQAICVRLCDRVDVFCPELHEVVVISHFDKQVFGVIAAVEDMVIPAWKIKESDSTSQANYNRE